jgi:hypothetical protein
MLLYGSVSMAMERSEGRKGSGSWFQEYDVLSLYSAKERKTCIRNLNSVNAVVAVMYSGFNLRGGRSLTLS